MSEHANRLIAISGSTPGVLDPCQPHRVLRHPEATLSFVAFDPLTASGASQGGFTRMDYPQQHVVIESLPNGEQTWKFVPYASRDIMVADEGSWPRVINICGNLVFCSSDQWDIYKLDSAYECHVHAPPGLTAIFRKSPAAGENVACPPAPHDLRGQPPDGDLRHRCYERGGWKSDLQFNLQRSETAASAMSICTDAPAPPHGHDEPEHSPGAAKRQAPSELDSDRSRPSNKMFDHRSDYTKRSRDLSPATVQRKLNRIAHNRDQAKKKRRKRPVLSETTGYPFAKLDPQSQMEPCVPSGQAGSGEDTKDPSSNSRIHTDAEPATESKEAIGNLTNVQKMKPSKYDGADEDEGARTEVAKWRAARQQLEEESMEGRWTIARALNRYVALLEWCGKRPAGQRLRLDDIPWPTLTNPRAFSLEKVRWEAVEEFFSAAEARLGDYSGLIKESRRRLHPDRWQATLSHIKNIEDRDRALKAIETVAQVVASSYDQYKTVKDI
ncbi:hypothetical protein BV22DRAFT_1135718 [Leucogyrophana mollusca]|uniref:Uncharacterized protein n=1 Tax=Leucogyrophana mollusca TaxID=85980 RepID=A0ACB8AUN1_9AGAM|nr:hypothetical protein BV22DRAFT_1135718 [Leucogyrophana mollusca]